MTTNFEKPIYSAEVSAKVSILNFKATCAVMESYLLGIIVSRERPDVEAEKTQLITLQTDTNR